MGRSRFKDDDLWDWVGDQLAGPNFDIGKLFCVSPLLIAFCFRSPIGISFSIYCWGVASGGKFFLPGPFTPFNYVKKDDIIMISKNHAIFSSIAEEAYEHFERIYLSFMAEEAMDESENKINQEIQLEQRKIRTWLDLDTLLILICISKTATDALTF